jgi:hypothetical protein
MRVGIRRSTARVVPPTRTRLPSCGGWHSQMALGTGRAAPNGGLPMDCIARYQELKGAEQRAEHQLIAFESETDQRHPLSDDQRTRLDLLDQEWGAAWDALHEYGDSILSAPINSLDDLNLKLPIIADREGLSQPVAYYTKCLSAQIREYQLRA